MAKDPVRWWMFGCVGLAATTLTVGAVSRLTRSGVSMLYWKPHGSRKPRNEQEWLNEYEVYHGFCQRHQRTPMTLEDFKQNYKWEYMHRLLGQTTAVAFAGPLGYFFVKGMIPAPIQAPLALVLALGATQFYLGKRFVQRHVHDRHVGEDVRPDVTATLGLPSHEAFSLVNLSLLLWAGFQLVHPTARAVKLRELTSSSALKEIGDIRKYMQMATAMLSGTILAGTIVAEIDAGQAYNTFPKMGDQWIPNGLFEKQPRLRNFYDNVALVQLDHRVLALATATAYTAIYVKARKPNVWANLPDEAKMALSGTMIAIHGQVLFGVTMLLNHIPASLAMVHQSGAALILGSSLWSLYTLRFARPFGLIGAAKAVKNVT